MRRWRATGHENRENRAGLLGAARPFLSLPPRVRQAPLTVPRARIRDAGRGDASDDPRVVRSGTEGRLKVEHPYGRGLDIHKRFVMARVITPTQQDT